MNKVSITRLSEYAQKVKSQKSQDVTIRPDSVRLQLLNIELTREVCTTTFVEGFRKGAAWQQKKHRTSKQK